MHSVGEIPQLEETLTFFAREHKIYILNCYLAFGIKGREQGREKTDKLNVEAKTKTLKLAEKSYVVRNKT